MPSVIFHDSFFDFNTIKLKSLKSDKKYGIYFLSDYAEQLYHDLQKEKSPITGTTFDKFAELKKHMSKTHQLFHCDLCTKHYLLFPGTILPTFTYIDFYMYVYI